MDELKNRSSNITKATNSSHVIIIHKLTQCLQQLHYAHDTGLHRTFAHQRCMFQSHFLPFQSRRVAYTAPVPKRIECLYPHGRGTDYMREGGGRELLQETSSEMNMLWKLSYLYECRCKQQTRSRDLSKLKRTEMFLILSVEIV